MRRSRRKIYGAREVVGRQQGARADRAARRRTATAHYPVCVAKTQYSFSTDPQLRGAPTGPRGQHPRGAACRGRRVHVVMSGDIMTMPGLPKEPAADNIDIDADGKIVGLA